MIITKRNPHKTKSVKELGPVDISGIKGAILEIPEEVWNLENQDKPNKFTELHKARHIVFRFVENMQDCTVYYDRPIWDEWKDKIQPVLDEAVKPYGYENGEFSRIMLARLEAGGEIAAHKDGSKAATFPHKIHIPIQTNDKVFFFANPKMYSFKEAHAYEVNNLDVHYAENGGDEDRIHLIFEYFNPEHVNAMKG